LPLRTTVALLAVALLAAACGTRVENRESNGQAFGLVAVGDTLGGDVGVTADEITIANLADLTGPVPGLFKAAQDGMKAFVAYINSEGGVNGRQLKLVTYDTNTNATEHRIATSQACDEAFAIVGSFSVGDNGGAAEGEECGIPNVIDVATTPQAAEAENTVAPTPVVPNLWPTGPANYIKEQFPDAIEKAGILSIDNPITRQQGEKPKRTAESVGYDFIYEAFTPAVESNFAPYVVDMRRQEVEYLTWSGEYQNLGRLLEAMQQQDFRPEVVDLGAVAYNQGFLRQAGEAAEGVHITLNVALLEEAKGNPEMTKYLDWLEREVPGARPDIFGIYSWSAGLLFVEALEAAGDNPNRETLLEALKEIHQWDGKGLHAPSDPGAALPPSCFVYVTVEDGKFVREHPDEGFDCDHELYEIP
jgi:ABC-type branched-subunit amino acid transport system substrate-binding protein